MRKSVVNYREFKLSKINEPQFSHLKLLLGWVGYFIMYFITEQFIPMENCFVMHSRLDDIIPFCELFVVPYVFWYFLIVWSLWYFAMFNPKNFKNLMKYIIICQVVAMIVYIVFPNRQDLRPAVMPRDNIFTHIISLLYFADTDTNVCPSMHVAYSIGIASVWLKEKYAHWGTKLFVVITCILVCLSTMFIKQHSSIDVFAAVALCFVAEVMVFVKFWADKVIKTKTKA